MTVRPEPATKHARPFWGRVSLIESSVEETQRHSGLIVPMRFEGDSGVKRGVVLEVDTTWNTLAQEYTSEKIAPGTVVFYLDGLTLPDGTVIIDLQDILAFEDS